MDHTILRDIRVAFTVLNDDGQVNLRLRRLCVEVFLADSHPSHL